MWLLTSMTLFFAGPAGTSADDGTALNEQGICHGEKGQPIAVVLACITLGAIVAAHGLAP
ncbi:hypothetical protein AB0J43_06520 [Nonomuraea fuscirosea]